MAAATAEGRQQQQLTSKQRRRCRDVRRSLLAQVGALVQDTPRPHSTLCICFLLLLLLPFDVNCACPCS